MTKIYDVNIKLTQVAPLRIVAADPVEAKRKALKLANYAHFGTKPSFEATEVWELQNGGTIKVQRDE